MKSVLITLIILTTSISYSQLQSIRGVVLDKDSKSPLIGANIIVLDVDPIIGAATDFDGRFKIEKVPLGRHTIQISFIGYETKTMPNIEVTSGKEVIINAELQESILIDEVVIEAKQDKDKTINKMASVSARTFSIDETMRYAGSLNDVARMAQNFAGVQGADDSRNDIVIRGNSPTGVLYRLEDVDIPNPNHFALNGTTGGPVSILNNNVLDNSDFMTGAFPAEYGNAIAGVFDLKLRSGNNQKHEFLGQFGFNGIELMAEGPINKDKYSSYIVDFRYSTLKLFQLMGLNFGTGTAVPDYSDGFFKLSFPNEKGKTEFWALGGASDIAFLDSEQKEENLFQEGGEDLFFNSKIGVTGLSNTYRFNDKSYLKTTFSIDATFNQIARNYLDSITQLYDPNYRNTSVEGKQSLNVIYNHKLSSRHLIKVGSYNYRRFFNLSDSINIAEDSIMIAPSTYQVIPERWVTLTDFKGATYFIQPFIQWQFRVNEKLTLNTGVHSQYFTYNNQYSVEPRLGLKWELNAKNTLSLAYGLHNQLPTTRLYFKEVETENGTRVIPNKNLEMIQSQHFVLGYDRNLGKHTRIKTEAYYQLLDNVPVDVNTNSYSVLNFGANFDLSFPDTLVNKGTGTNYGVELTLERFLNNGFYYLMTTSIYNSTYKGSDGVERNTVFNGNYTFNALVGKEFFFKPKEGKVSKSSLLIDLKGTLNGGQRYVPIDLQASQLIGQTVYDYDQAFANRYPDYLRMDFKIGFKKNGKKITQEWSFNIQNLTNRKNVFTEGYSDASKSIVTRYQTGLLPIGQYKIWF
jgi:hypothetical protein